MGETENTQAHALLSAMVAATEAMGQAEAKIQELRGNLARIHQLALDLPCTCWINQPKCPVCQMVEMSHNG
jgi:hypothetical protein